MESVEIPEVPQQKEAIEKGDPVKVVRSSGGVDSGWQVGGFSKDTKRFTVLKDIEGQRMQKKIPRVELYALNRPENDSSKFPFQEWIDLWQKVGGIAEPGLSGPKLMSPREARVFFQGERAYYEQAKEQGKRVAISEQDRLQAKLAQAYFGRRVPPEFQMTDEKIRRITGT